MELPQLTGKEAHNEYYRLYRENNREKVRNYNRKYNKAWRKKHGYHNEENSKKRYPERTKARRLLNYAVKKGEVKKQPCEVCMSWYVQAHHDDYTKPLQVRWLCALHHAILEKRASELKRQDPAPAIPTPPLYNISEVI